MSRLSVPLPPAMMPSGDRSRRLRSLAQPCSLAKTGALMLAPAPELGAGLTVGLVFEPASMAGRCRVQPRHRTYVSAAGRATPGQLQCQSRANSDGDVPHLDLAWPGGGAANRCIWLGEGANSES